MRGPRSLSEARSAESKRPHARPQLQGAVSDTPSPRRMPRCVARHPLHFGARAQVGGTGVRRPRSLSEARSAESKRPRAAPTARRGVRHAVSAGGCRGVSPGIPCSSACGRRRGHRRVAPPVVERGAQRRVETPARGPNCKARCPTRGLRGGMPRCVAPRGHRRGHRRVAPPVVERGAQRRVETPARGLNCKARCRTRRLRRGMPRCVAPHPLHFGTDPGPAPGPAAAQSAQSASGAAGTPASASAAARCSGVRRRRCAFDGRIAGTSPTIGTGVRYRCTP